jgi:hypothetical protein
MDMRFGKFRITPDSSKDSAQIGASPITALGRCTKLGVEGISEIGRFEENLARAVLHFGSVEAFSAVRVGDYFLPDEIKICGINLKYDL